MTFAVQSPVGGWTSTQVTTDDTRTAQVDIRPCMLLLTCPDTYEMHAESKQQHQIDETATGTALQGME